MALKLGGSKASGEVGIQRRGETWFCPPTNLPTDVLLHVEGRAYHLHKFPLTRSGKLARLINADDAVEIVLEGVPGGASTFELAVQFCYKSRLDLTASNAVPLRCAAEYLEMGGDSDDEDNLVTATETYFNQVTLRSWKDSVKALASCERVLGYADRLGLVKRCIDSIASKCCCSDPGLLGWPLHHSAAQAHMGGAAGGALQSPGGSVLWNGISSGARPRKAARIGWWYDDVVGALSISMFKRLIDAMEARGIKPEIIGGAVVAYAQRYLPGLHRRHGGGNGSSSGGGGGGSHRSTGAIIAVTTDMDQVELLESIEQMLPSRKGTVPTWFLAGMLRLALMLRASEECKADLEARIGLQLDQARVDDILLPNFMDTALLYDLDVVQRILDHFVASYEQHNTAAAAAVAAATSYQEAVASPAGPMLVVADILDAYLIEIAPDTNVKPETFRQLALSLPDYARVVDDGLYNAVDEYLKAHHWLSELEKEKLCRIINSHKLSLETCTHAATNDRFPQRFLMGVIFLENLHLRSIIEKFFSRSEIAPAEEAAAAATSGRHRQQDGEATTSRAGAAGRNETWTNVLKENQAMRSDMDKLRSRVVELEKEWSQLRQLINKLSKAGSKTGPKAGGIPSGPLSFARRLGCSSRFDCQPHSQKLPTASGREQTGTLNVKRPDAAPRHGRSHSIA